LVHKHSSLEFMEQLKAITENIMTIEQCLFILCSWLVTIVHNGWRYVQLESAAFGPSVARVFARDFSYCRSIICINLNNLGIRNTEYVLKN
jgi:hypothetical protein